eukprot:scaffold49878_cov40-Tisochrysis_lutea.AAC.6
MAEELVPALMRWLVLVVDQLFWSIVAPPAALFGWVPLRLCSTLLVHAALLHESPAWLETPFDTLSYWYLLVHGVRVCEEGASGGVVESTILVPGIRTFRGAVLMNHRSWGDFVIDPMQASASVVARGAATAAMLLAGLLGIVTKRVIVIFRRDGPCCAATSREELQRMCRHKTRYLIYPEGTRRAAEPNADEPDALRVGGLKNIWESSDEAMIVITVGKENIVNERRGHVSYSTTLYRATHPPIRAADHPTLESFLDAIDKAWRDTWARAYDVRLDDLERGSELTSKRPWNRA